MLISEALKAAAEQLQETSDASELDARWLLLQVLQESETREASWLDAHGDEELTTVAEQHFRRLIDERATGRPLAYLLGWWEFYGRRFRITEDVLIPRPTTEQLVDETLDYLTTTLRNVAVKRGQPFVVADVGTGSGCIAVTLALESGMRNQELRFIATDISPAALAVAQENARRHGVADKIEFIAGNMLIPLQGRSVDLIVSNPPYVPTRELSPEPPGAQGKSDPSRAGLRFEPQIALDGGPDGQRFTKSLLNLAVPSLVEVTGGDVRQSLGHTMPA